MRAFRMTTPQRIAVMAALLAPVLVVGVTPAWAPGSLSLHEVQIAVRSVPRLVAEINSALETGGVGAGTVICMAGRHGNHWTYLGGRRAAPYECTIGTRVLRVEARITYYDAKGRPLGDVEAADPRRAKTFKETNFRWTWTP